MNTYAIIGTVLQYKGEEVVVIAHDMEQTHYLVQSVDKRIFWIAASLTRTVE